MQSCNDAPCHHCYDALWYTHRCRRNAPRCRRIGQRAEHKNDAGTTMKSVIVATMILGLVAGCRETIHLATHGRDARAVDAASSMDATDDGAKDAQVTHHDGGLDSGRDADTQPNCHSTGTACVGDFDCCSGICLSDPDGPSLCISATGCRPANMTCDRAMDCCSHRCDSGLCRNGSGCVTNGVTCQTDSDCCSDSCLDGKCRHLDQCRTAGDDCGKNDDCCSHTCRDQGGTKKQCLLLPLCRVRGEPCSNDFDCCSGQCEVTSQGKARCAAQPAGTCLTLGAICHGPQDCCSRICLDVDHTVTRCQPTGNCLDTGERCDLGGICCSGLCQAGQDGVHRCESSACGQSGSHCTRDQDCCDPQPGICRPDSLAVPRCQSPPDTPCTQAGYGCALSDQCCNGPCLPNDASALTCAPNQCLGPGRTCSGPGQCCAPLLCRLTNKGLRCVE